MGLLRSLINKFWNKQVDDEIDFKGTQGILIKPDGTWTVAKPPTKTPPTNPPKIIKMPSAPPPGKDYLYYSANSDLEDLSFPPDYFPYAKDLYDKLEQCVDMDIVSSCTHKQTHNSVYILSVQLPCGDNHTDSMKKFKMFIRAMEETYKLTAIQQERQNSSTCSDKYYLVIFEYDPRKFLITKLRDGEE